MAYIGLDRGIVDHWIYQDAEYFKVWFEMLYRARFAKEPATELIEGQLVVIEHGEFIFGRIKWSERLGISERRLRTLMDKLVADNMIHLTQRAPKFSKYCVTNFAKYRPQNDHQQTLDAKGIADSGDHQNDQQTTSKRPANDQQTTTKEEFNNLITITSTSISENNEPKTAMDAYIFCFKKLQYTGFIANYVMQLFGRGLTDSFVREVFMQMGENGLTNPNLDYMKKIAEDWIAKGIGSRKEALQLKETQKEGVNHETGRGNAEFRGRNQGNKAGRNPAAGEGKEQRESKVYPGRWDDCDVPLPSVQG